MTEETRPGFLANYKIVRPGPPRLGPARNLKTRPDPARPGSTRIRPSPVDTSEDYIFLVPPQTHWVTLRPCSHRTIRISRVAVFLPMNTYRKLKPWPVSECSFSSRCGCEVHRASDSGEPKKWKRYFKLDEVKFTKLVIEVNFIYWHLSKL